MRSGGHHCVPHIGVCGTQSILCLVGETQNLARDRSLLWDFVPENRPVKDPG